MAMSTHDRDTRPALSRGLYAGLLLAFLRIRCCESIAPPLVTSVAPDSGNVLGGQRVEISVDNFRPANNYACRFDAIDVVARYDNKKRKILCATPAHKAGTVYVEVGVQSVFSFASGIMFTYEPPLLFSVFPRRGPSWGELPVTITGTNFKNLDDRGLKDTYVRYQCRFSGTSFGDFTRPAGYVTTDDNPLVPTIAQLIWCYVPPSRPGTCVKIEVSMGGTLWDRARTPPVPMPYVVWSSDSNIEFCYERPTITSMWPLQGPLVGNTLLRITGLNLQPVETVRCYFENDDIGYGRKSTFTLATFQALNSLQFGKFFGVENDTEAIFCRTPPWTKALVKVYLDLDGQLSKNFLNFTYFDAKMTRISPKHVSFAGGTLIHVYGINFQNVTKPRCRFEGNRIPGYAATTVSVVPATFISSNIVTCRAPARTSLHSMSPHQTSFVTTDPAGPNNPWLEQVEVNTQIGSSYVLKLNGAENHAITAFHRSLVIFGDVTLEGWMKFDSVKDGTSPIWFGLTDELLNARFLYGIFARKRTLNLTKNLTLPNVTRRVATYTDVIDLEVGHSKASFGDGYSGRYNLTWPLGKVPGNATKVFQVGLQTGYWHHIAATRNATAGLWTLYINGSVAGVYHYNWPIPPVESFLPGKHTNMTHRVRLEKFFTQYDPFQRWRVEEWLTEYKGKERALYDYLWKLYPAASQDLENSRPGNLNRQDHTLEKGMGKGDEYLNAGGVDPRTRSSPFPCDPRIHGVSVCRLPWGSTRHHTVPNLWVGRGALKQQTHHGYLDDIRLWNVVRSAKDIAAYFEEELGGTETGLVTYYPFNEASGNMAYDRSSATSNPDTNKNNAHLLGYPRKMWHVEDLLSAFTNAKDCPHDRCSVVYTPSAQLRAPPDFLHEPKLLDFGISPSMGPVHGGTVITIQGRGFIEGPNLQCRFQGTVSRQGGQRQGTGLVKAEYHNINQITCISPAHTILGNTSVFVTNNGETFNTDPQVFEYSIVVPVLHRISVQPGPATGHAATYCPVRTPLNGGTTITIHGENFMQSDSTQLLLFRMGEMPALRVHKFVDDRTIIIKTPPLNTRFWGDPDFGAVPPDGYTFPESYAYPSPYPMREMRSGTSARNDATLDPRYPEWGQGKPFDCSRDAPGSTCYRPAFTVRVTNDGGRQWSGFPPYSTTRDSLGTLESRTNCVLYSDLVVSPDGDDRDGDGTLTRPFRSLIKAAQWAHGEGDRILMFRGSYPTAILQELLLQPKKLTVYQDSPLRTDQGGTSGGALPTLCKCQGAVEGPINNGMSRTDNLKFDAQSHTWSTKQLCKCEHNQGQPFLQQESTFQQTQHNDYDEFSRQQQTQHVGPPTLGGMLEAGHGSFRDSENFHGEAQIDVSDSLAHTDYMGTVDAAFDDAY